MNYLADVNVWIALVAEQHIHHPPGLRWFRNLVNEQLAFCRVTQMGFLRLLTNKHVMREEVMNPYQAWEAYRILRSDRRVGYMDEPAGLSEFWHSFTQGQAASPNLWTDAYLCAFAQAARLTLATFDAKIPKWTGVSCLVLGSAPRI
jgi:toxin-antitoxin system PIN domain toxin